MEQIKILNKKQNKIPVFFLIMSLLFGTIIALITPPIQGPDENIHFLYTWQFSQNKIDSTFPIEMRDFLYQHHYLRFQTQEKYSFEKFTTAFKIQNRNQEKFKYFIGPVKFFWYAPTTAGVFIGKIISNKFYIHMLMGRFFTLLCYSIIVYFAIKITPVFKFGFCLLALMPMSLFMASVISYDSFAIACSFLSIAFMLQLFLKEKMSKLQLISFIILILTMGVIKPFYILILSPIIIAPLFKKRLRNYWWISLILITTISTQMIIIKKTFTVDPQKINLAIEAASTQKDFESYDECYNVKISSKKNNLKRVTSSRLHRFFKEPSHFVLLFINTLTSPRQIALYGASFAGCLGWCDALLPPTILLFYYFLLIVSLFLEENFQFKRCDRMLFLATGIGLFTVLHLIFYFANLYEFSFIDGLQGRYFIEFSPLILIPFILSKKLKKRLFKKIEINLKIDKYLYFIIIFVNIITIVTLLLRYYFTYWWDRSVNIM